jgi:uncharacterized protein
VTEQTILWRRADLPGHDACALRETANGWRLQGTALFALDLQPCHLAYEVDCDAAWHTRSAAVAGWIGRGTVRLVILARPERRWDLDGADQPAVAGCVDLDLNFTPATNLIAIRRLALNIGDAADAPAAWLAFPEMRLEKLAQRYERVSVEQYRYQAPGVHYAEMLDVSGAGFITRYPGLWEMETLR